MQDLIASIQITSIVANLIVRLAAIAAGVYVVWLGHHTLVIGIKGEFQFEGSFAKLKGSSPGLLFVLLGCLAIGWALQSKHSGEYEATMTGRPATAATGGVVPHVPDLPSSPTMAPP